MMIEVVEEMEEVRMVPRARPRVPKFSEVWLAEVDISHVAVLKKKTMNTKDLDNQVSNQHNIFLISVQYCFDICRILFAQ